MTHENCGLHQLQLVCLQPPPPPCELCGVLRYVGFVRYGLWIIITALRSTDSNRSVTTESWDCLAAADGTGDDAPAWPAADHCDIIASLIMLGSVVLCVTVRCTTMACVASKHSNSNGVES